MGSATVTSLRVPYEIVPSTAARLRTEKAVTIWLPCLLLPVALLLWASALPAVNLDRMNDYGLVSVLPARIWAGLVLLILSFAVCWWRADRSGPLLAVHILLFIVMFYGIPALVAGSPRGPIVYRHAGIADYLTRTGLVDTHQDAYFSWPGFFMALGWTVDAGGLHSALALATWATVAVNVLYLPPLLMVLRALTRDGRLLWAAAFLFYIANWINQDYLAPQSFTYVFYLTILGLVLHYLRPREYAPPGRRPWATAGAARGPARWWAALRSGARPQDVPPTVVDGRTAALVTLVVLVLFAATVASHQLTPYALFFAVGLLVLTGHCRVRGLPLVMGVILVTWTIFVASGYIDGHLAKIAEGSGVGRSASSNLAQRLSGSPQHLQIVRERVVLSACLWLLAAAGAFYRFRTRHADHAAALLALAPVPLFLLPYGGEVLLRLYFFILPFAAFFAVALFLPDISESDPRTWASTGFALRRIRDVVLLGGVLSIIMAASFVARYGNERMDYYTPGETAAVRELYRVAPLGSYLLAEVDYLPWKYQDYEWNDAEPNGRRHKYLSLAQEWRLDPTRSPRDMALWTAETLRANTTAGRAAGFLILSRSQQVHEEILGGVPASTMDDFEKILVRSGKFTLVYSNDDARIYARNPGR